MSRQINININLTPTLEYDNSTGSYIIFYNEFPNAIATGHTEEEAENNLGFLVEDMWHKRSDDLKRYLLNHHEDSIKINSTTKC